MVSIPKLLLICAAWYVPLVLVFSYLKADPADIFWGSLVAGCILGLLYSVPEETK